MVLTFRLKLAAFFARYKTDVTGRPESILKFRPDRRRCVFLIAVCRNADLILAFAVGFS